MHVVSFKVYKRTETELELLVDQPEIFQPGQFLAFSGGAVGKIAAIRHSTRRATGLLRVELLSSQQPDLTTLEAELLTQLPRQSAAVETEPVVAADNDLDDDDSRPASEQTPPLLMDDDSDSDDVPFSFSLSILEELTGTLEADNTPVESSPIIADAPVTPVETMAPPQQPPVSLPPPPSQNDASPARATNTTSLPAVPEAPLPASAPEDTHITDSASSLRFQVGDKVQHPKYGQGQVKKVIMLDPEQEILNIWFDRGGKRLLDPSLSALEKLS